MSRFHRRASALATLAAVGVAVAASACSEGGAVPPTDLELPGQDVSSWALPLDPYLPPYYEAQYARQLLTQECMRSAGYEFDVAAVDLDTPPPETANAAGRRLFDTTIAAQYGYHFAPSERVDRRQAQEIAQRAFAPDETVEAERCLEVVLERLGAPNDSLSDWLGFTVEVAEDAAVAAAVGRWQSCLEAIQPGRVTDWPENMPVEGDALAFDLAHATDWDAAPPTPGEIALAVDDARCRDSSGFRDAYYQSEWSAQVELVRDNWEGLQEEREFNRQYRLRVMDIISQYAPR